MDRKSYIILIGSFVLLAVWFPVTNRMFPPTPVPRTTNTFNVATNGLASQTNAGVSPAPSAAFTAGNTNGVASSFTVSPGKEEIVTVENQSGIYTFSSPGGGLKSIALKGYPATIDCKRQPQIDTNNLATLNSPAPVPALTILGDSNIEGDGYFRLTQLPGSSGVRAEKGLSNGLYIIKEFLLSTNFLVKSTVRIENRSQQSIALSDQEWVIGTATPIGLQDETLMLGVQWYNGSKAEDVSDAWFANRPLGCLPGTPRQVYMGGESNVVWAAVLNQFFVLVAVPNEPATRIIARKIALPALTKEQMASDVRAMAHPFGYQAAFGYSGLNLGPNQSVQRGFDVYAGPKEYNTLARLEKNLDLVMNFGFFGFFAKGLLLSMNGLYALGLSYGLAIVVITVIIKTLFWPLTAASTRSMKRMAALQPQMKAIQEKYKEDPRKMNMKVMEFMRENKVSPLGGCLPMLLQIPVFIGFYTMLQSAIELRGAKFLWACDLSQADTVWIIPGFNFPLNLMPLLMGVTMVWQARLTPPSPGMDPVQQKIMKYMPLMFMVFLYNFSAGLTLYWTVQNLLTILQMKLTKTHDPVVAAGAQPSVLAPKSSLSKKKKP